MPLRVCFLTAEISPFAKTGGLGDVSAALSRYLSRRGHDVRVFVPLHGQMDTQGLDRHPVANLQGLSVQVGSRTFQYKIGRASCRERVFGFV
jgi:starch synthase